MNEVKRTLLEFAVVAAVAVPLALAANALNPEGLSLGRDYFGGRDVSERTKEEVRARLAKKGIQILEHAAVLGLYNDPIYQDGAYTFIDSRSEAEYQRGHIPGAYLCDHYRVERYANEVVPVCQSSLQVVVYCEGGDCNDSELTAEDLFHFRVPPENLFVYIGGLEEWCSQGMPIERGARDSGDIAECPK
ncbi:MAG: hypothetical protein HY812_01305 [Planctomycetes bacterium]|nr:hypothetical protein [Planctomycetota bacterium]